MKSLFNLFYRARQILPICDAFVPYLFRALILFSGYIRALFFGFRGLVKVNGRPATLNIGITSGNIFQSGARLELNFPTDLRELNGLEKLYFSPDVTLGQSLHWAFLNPPESRKNRFRLLQDAFVEFNGRTNIGQGFYISLKDRARFRISDRVYIGKRFYCALKTGLEIGSGCLIGDDFKVIDYDGHQVKSPDEELPIDLGGKSKAISIGNNVWIAWNVMVTKGVSIGDGSIVASNSFVTQSVPPNSLVMGNPAKIVKANISWQNF